MHRWTILALVLALGCSDSETAGERPNDAGTGGTSGSGGAGGNAGSSGSGATTPGGPLVTKPFTESSGDIISPERGFYDQVDVAGDGSMDHVRAAGRTLAYSGVRLDAYRNVPIAADFLTKLDAGFERARQAGIKIVLRLVYNAGPYPNSEPDAPVDQVLEHLQQLQPILEKNADVIAVMQAGLIGAWGEWPTSTNGLDTPENKKTILLALLDALPASRMTQIRTPSDKSAIFGEAIADGEAFTGVGKARTGHHNDCFLASPSDYGTYPDPIETWKDYVAQDGRFTPIGGETCGLNPPRTDCPEATQEMQRLHWSFLNALYNTSVIDGWQQQGCLEDIRRSLGYRVVLSEASYSQAVRPGGVLELEVKLTNTGYAALFNERPVLVVLDDGTSLQSAVLPLVDPRRWESGQAVTLTAKLRIPASAKPGAHRIGLWLPDAAPTLRDRTEYAVRFANDGTWDDAGGFNVLADDLEIDPSAPGDSDPNATTFEALP